MSDDVLREIRDRFDLRAASYDDSTMHRGLAEAVAAFAAPPPDSVVLDVATGTGLLLRALPARNATGRLIGVDLSPGMLAVAREHLPDATLIEADATVLPLRDSSVDLVTCVTGLQLFPSAGPAIAEWARVLRTGGRAVTATFARFDPSRHRAAPPSSTLHHEPFATPDALATTVAPAGFVVGRHEFWSDGADTVLIAELLPATEPAGLLSRRTARPASAPASATGSPPRPRGR